MSEAPPQLGNLPQHSDLNVPTINSNGSSNALNSGRGFENAKHAVYGNAQSAFNTVSNHPVAQDLRNTVSNGPMAETVKDQHAKTTNELSNLASARTTPSHKAATGQPLTHYHSFFWHLVTWEEPRGTAVAFASTILMIFVARYVPIFRLAAKGLSYILGAVTLAELAGRFILSNGLMASFRPRKYLTIPRDSLEATLGDLEQLINFFVIETQRIVFAENVGVTALAFVTVFISYWLIKFVPFWGLSLIGTCVMYLTPLIYLQNKEIIDQQLAHVSRVVASQASQVKDLAGHHTARATETVKGYAGEYTTKAQSMIGNAAAKTSNTASAAKRSTSGTVRSAANDPSGTLRSAADGSASTLQSAADGTTNTFKSAANDANHAFNYAADGTTGTFKSAANDANHAYHSATGDGSAYSANDFPRAPRQEPAAGAVPLQDQYERSQFGGQADPAY